MKNLQSYCRIIDERLKNKRWEPAILRREYKLNNKIHCIFIFFIREFYN